MITIFHGNNTQLSRNEFLKKKDEFGDVISLNEKKLDKEELLSIFSGGLFGTDKNLALENLLSKNKPSKLLTDFILILNNNSKDSNIILWEEKEIGKKNLDFFKNYESKIFQLPRIIFNFLDEFKPGNGRSLVLLFHKLLETNAIEIIIYMIIRQLRLMIAFSDGTNNIDEVKRMSPWQRSKLSGQSRLFGVPKLKRIYKDLYRIDISQKSGKLKIPLTSAIDIFLLGI